MYGILGGLLELVNLLGGIVLWILIGAPAWKKNRTARWSRVLIGSIPTGLLLATVPVVSVWIIEGGPNDSASIARLITTAIVSALVCILGVCGLASLLEVLRKAIDHDRNG